MRLSILPILLLHICIASFAGAISSSPNTGGLILRVRLEDGSMQKIQVLAADNGITLEKVLQRYTISDGARIQIGKDNSDIGADDLSKSLDELELKNGSLITIRPKASKTKAKASFALSAEESNTFQPFPELAKNYQSALRQRAQKQRHGGGGSFGELSTLQSALHKVEPQPEGPLKRVYMCHVSAARFHASCTTGTGNRVGLLLGTINRERVDNMKKPKARTSLSSTPSAQDFCEVGKVHCLWEPTQQEPSSKSSSYDASSLLKEGSWDRIRTLAAYLGLQPIGWIFTYSDKRVDEGEEADALPVWGVDVDTGAHLQAGEMKVARQDKTTKPFTSFATLAMDATTGATEAFQLSDVAVQMASEGMLLNEKKPSRHVSTKHAILVDGQETSTLDSVLCLVNTALLSHEGLYAGNEKKPTKKNGTLNSKAKKALLAAMEECSSTSDAPLLQLLCDFQVLVALDSHATMKDADIQEICRVVQKFARGQKQGATLSSKLKRKLQTLLEL
jgi:hypothetical protein